jgi:hypothetical protein
MTSYRVTTIEEFMQTGQKNLRAYQNTFHNTFQNCVLEKGMCVCTKGECRYAENFIVEVR